MRGRDENLRIWVLDSVAALRRANLKASQASEEWNALNEGWKDKIKAEGWDYLEAQRRKADNQPLKDAFGAAQYWQQEAMRIAASIEAEATAKKLFAYANREITVEQL